MVQLNDQNLHRPRWLAYLLAVGMLAMPVAWVNKAYALDLEGTVWNTIDDETGQRKAEVTFTKQGDTYSAHIVKLLSSDGQAPCEDCAGAFRNKTLNGVQIVKNLKRKGENSYGRGDIVDPKKDKTYSMKADVIEGGAKLKVRGYIGISLMGRTQTWLRVNK